MPALDFLDDFVLGPLDLINRLEGVLSGIRYRDTGYRMTIRRADKGGNLSGRQVEKLLNSYGVVIYGRTHDSAHLNFLVKRRQARWAEYLLLHAGVQLVSPTFDRRNPGYVARHAPGWMPTPWSDHGRQPTPAQPATSPPVPSPPLLKRLLRWLDD